MRYSLDDKYQILLILLALIATGLFGVFLTRELFPEYKEYQKHYVAMEEIRSEMTGEAVAPFKGGIEQIVMARADKGPETIDRCVSCHVAMKLPHFSPEKVARDVNGEIMVDAEGVPIKVPNDEYIWAKIDAQVADLRNEETLEKLRSSGKHSEVKKRLSEAKKLEGMKVRNIHGDKVDMTRVLSAHPLLGRETYPFEYHPLADYGCTVCHGGNGRGLVSDKAHGPVFDGAYEPEAHPPKPDFIESDSENDPPFARVFNDKPGHHLLFQTTPVMTGGLMQARCVQCHQTAADQFKQAVETVGVVKDRKEAQVQSIRQGIHDEEQALLSLLELKKMVLSQGVEETIKSLRGQRQNFKLTPDEMDRLNGRLDFITKVRKDCECQDLPESKTLAQAIADRLDQKIIGIVGSSESAKKLEELFALGSLEARDEVIAQLRSLQTEQAKGSFFQKLQSYEKYQQSLRRVEHASEPIARVAQDKQLLSKMSGEADGLTLSYQRGRDLFMANACYACHRISGYSRGGVGPELTQAGLLYPWYLKEAITWPQSNLKSSTMPNFRLDHEEVEDLMAYLMAQRGESRAVSEMGERVAMKAWEGGAKRPWEEPMPAGKVKDVEASQLVFATEGCAACHRLRGFKGSTGFAVEKGDPSFAAVWKERQWLREILPENSIGSQIVATIDRHGAEIDRRIHGDVHPSAVLERIDETLERGVESFYPPFKFALRAKNTYFKERLAQADSAEVRAAIEAEKALYLDRVRRLMAAFVQEYGFGREIGPRLHWSGIYRDQQWLIEHFRNPSAHTAKSLMPVFPYDDSKYYALTNMLQVLAKQNRDDTRQIWKEMGFNPEVAYEMHCSSCHGQFLHGDGPISTWIYPIPKNLRNNTFLKNLTKERLIESLAHGVGGTPMPPWGESAKNPLGGDMGSPVLTASEIELLANWLYLGLSSDSTQEEPEKWRYSPEDFLEELEQEGGIEDLDLGFIDSPLDLLPKGEGLWASLEVPVGWTAGAQSDVEAIFDVNKDEGVASKYYIKKRYYTAKNLSEGQRLFIANCAHCHGKEGGGNGDRAASMEDAKPRMLSNLPWLESRDDLRLLRSLKYGVPGTPMTPWGDKTSALQRMQMVMFIRQLTADRQLRDSLSSALYRAFEQAVFAIEDVRALQGKKVLEAESAYDQAKVKREQLFGLVETGEAAPKDAAESYQEELLKMSELAAKKRLQEQLLALSGEVNAEKGLWASLGSTFISSRVDQALMEGYLSVIAVNENFYRVSEGQLSMKDPAESQEKMKALGDQLLHTLLGEEESLKAEQSVVEAQLPSASRTESLEDLASRITSLQNLRRKLISTMEQSKHSKKKQQSLYQSVVQQLNVETGTSFWGVLK